MGNLLSTLGLGAVETDPNALPDGKWDGEIKASEYVFHKAKNAGADAPRDHISHVITYRVTEGDRKGAERQEWNAIAKVTEWAEDGKTPKATQAVMTESQKPWYKKRLIDLGVEEDTIETTFKPEDLVGKKVTFGTKKNGAYINVNFVELREPPAAASPTTTILGSL